MNRWLRIMAYLLVLAALSWYGAAKNPFVPLSRCLAEPEKYKGITLQIGTEVSVKEVYSDGFTIYQMGQVARVKGDPSGVKPGDYVSLIAVFQPPAMLELEKLYIARGRRVKIAISVLPAVAVMIVLLRCYRFDFKHFIIRER